MPLFLTAMHEGKRTPLWLSALCSGQGDTLDELALE